MILMAKRKSNAGRKPRGYEVAAFQVRLPVELHKQLLAAISKSRRTKNAEVTLAVEAWLSAMNLPVPPSMVDTKRRA